MKKESLKTSMRSLAIGLSLFAANTSLSAAHGTLDPITSTTEIDGDVLIDLASGTGIKVSGTGSTVSLAAGHEDAVVTINGSYGIDAQSGGRVELGKVIINQGRSGTNFSLSARGDGSYISVGDNSIMQNSRMGGVVNTYVNGEVRIGNNVEIVGISSSTLSATVFANSGNIFIGDDANITSDGTINTGLEPIGMVKTIQANAGGSVTIGKNATITAKTDGKTGNHAVIAGLYYSTNEYGIGTIDIGSGANISTDGSTAYAVTSALVGSKVTIGAGSTISTTGSGSHAVYAEKGGAIELKGATITTAASNAKAVVATSDKTESSAVTGTGVFNITGEMQTVTNGKIDLNMQGGSRFKGFTTNGTGGSVMDIDMFGSVWDITKNSTLTHLNVNAKSTLIFNVKSKSSFIKITSGVFALEDSTIQVVFDSSYTAKLGDAFRIVVADSYDVDRVMFDINYDITDLGLMWDTSTFGVDGTIRVAELVIPEPAAFAALLGTIVLLGAIRRRR